MREIKGVWLVCGDSTYAFVDVRPPYNTAEGNNIVARAQGYSSERLGTIRARVRNTSESPREQAFAIQSDHNILKGEDVMGLLRACFPGVNLGVRPIRTIRGESQRRLSIRFAAEVLPRG
jgi:hypothetical protein